LIDYRYFPQKNNINILVLVSKRIAANFLDKPDYETLYMILFILVSLLSNFLSKEFVMNTSCKKHYIDVLVPEGKHIATNFLHKPNYENLY
jgi:hypothetical protein